MCTVRKRGRRHPSALRRSRPRSQVVNLPVLDTGANNKDALQQLEVIAEKDGVTASLGVAADRCLRARMLRDTPTPLLRREAAFDG